MNRIIIVATQNSHKLQELQKLLGDLGAPVRSLADYGGVPEVVEDRDTLEAPRKKKLWLHWSQPLHPINRRLRNLLKLVRKN